MAKLQHLKHAFDYRAVRQAMRSSDRPALLNINRELGLWGDATLLMGKALHSVASLTAPAATRGLARAADTGLDAVVGDLGSKPFNALQESVYNVPFIGKRLPRNITGHFPVIGLGSLGYLAGVDHAIQPTSSFYSGASTAQNAGEQIMTNIYGNAGWGPSPRPNRRVKRAALSGARAVAGAGMRSVGDLLQDMVTTKRVTPAVGTEWLEAPEQVITRYRSDPKALADQMLAGTLKEDGDKLLMRNRDYKPEVETREISYPKALGVTAGALGLYGLTDIGEVVNNAASDTFGYRVNKDMNSLADRVEATDTFAKSFLQQAGKNTANIVSAPVAAGAAAGTRAISDAVASGERQDLFNRVVKSDDYMSRATPQDKDLLRRAYGTLQRFAPELAGDEFAVRNYLRESLMSSNGPDYATIANLARANRDVAGPGTRMPKGD